MSNCTSGKSRGSGCGEFLGYCEPSSGDSRLRVLSAQRERGDPRDSLKTLLSRLLLQTTPPTPTREQLCSGPPAQVAGPSPSPLCADPRHASGPSPVTARCPGNSEARQEGLAQGLRWRSWTAEGATFPPLEGKETHEDSKPRRQRGGGCGPVRDQSRANWTLPSPSRKAPFHALTRRVTGQGALASPQGTGCRAQWKQLTSRWPPPASPFACVGPGLQQ